jgi:serine/threonine protein kinase
MKPDSETSIGILDRRYILMEELGEGISSKVFKVKDSLSNKIYAAKVFFENSKLIEKEIEYNKIISQNINNEFPYFLKYITSSVGPFELKNDLKNSHTPENKAYIIFELGTKGILKDYITLPDENLDERHVQVLFMEIAKAVNYLHQLGICHRDLKTENIALSGEEFIIKILDFGSSSKIIRFKDGRIKYQKERVGTPGYQAPEIVAGHAFNGEKVDIFSLGVILFFLMTGFHCFKEARYHNPNLVKNKADIIYNFIIDEKKHEDFWKIVEMRLPVKKKLSEQFKILFLKMVANTSKERPTLNEILNDDYFSNIKALTKDQLQALKQEIINELRRRESLIKKKK